MGTDGDIGRSDVEGTAKLMIEIDRFVKLRLE